VVAARADPLRERLAKCDIDLIVLAAKTTSSESTKTAANCEDTSAAGPPSAPTLGSVSSADFWCAMSISSPPTAPSSTSNASESHLNDVYGKTSKCS
jgi:hypothetical protein